MSDFSYELPLVRYCAATCLAVEHAAERILPHASEGGPASATKAVHQLHERGRRLGPFSLDVGSVVTGPCLMDIRTSARTDQVFPRPRHPQHPPHQVHLDDMVSIAVDHVSLSTSQQ